MDVAELGEFGLIDRLAGLLAERASAETAGRLAVGIGDDAAVWRADGAAVLATTDTLVADVHFLADRTPWRDLGWKAIAVNVSDIAAMGGTPDFALVTLALPHDAQAEQMDELYEGVAEACEAYGVAVAGGDVVRAPVLVITVALTGRAELDASREPLVLRRDAAQAGDIVAVTGTLGGAAGGLHALRNDDESEATRALIERHLRPQARASAGPAAVAAGIRCGIDVSDGLLQDLGHVCRLSRLGTVVWRDRLPLDPAVVDAFGPDEAVRYAATGGDDYELLFAGNQPQIDELARQVDVPVTVIGEMVIDPDQQAKLLDEAGRELDVPSSGWDHLRGD